MYISDWAWAFFDHINKSKSANVTLKQRGLKKKYMRSPEQCLWVAEDLAEYFSTISSENWYSLMSRDISEGNNPQGWRAVVGIMEKSYLGDLGSAKRYSFCNRMASWFNGPSEDKHPYSRTLLIVLIQKICDLLKETCPFTLGELQDEHKLLLEGELVITSNMFQFFEPTSPSVKMQVGINSEFYEEGYESCSSSVVSTESAPFCSKSLKQAKRVPDLLYVDDYLFPTPLSLVQASEKMLRKRGPLLFKKSKESVAAANTRTNEWVEKMQSASVANNVLDSGVDNPSTIKNISSGANVCASHSSKFKTPPPSISIESENLHKVPKLSLDRKFNVSIPKINILRKVCVPSTEMLETLSSFPSTVVEKSKATIGIPNPLGKTSAAKIIASTANLPIPTYSTAAAETSAEPTSPPSQQHPSMSPCESEETVYNDVIDKTKGHAETNATESFPEADLHADSTFASHVNISNAGNPGTSKSFSNNGTSTNKSSNSDSMDFVPEPSFDELLEKYDETQSTIPLDYAKNLFATKFKIINALIKQFKKSKEREAAHMTELSKAQSESESKKKELDFILGELIDDKDSLLLGARLREKFGEISDAWSGGESEYMDLVFGLVQKLNEDIEKSNGQNEGSISFSWSKNATGKYQFHPN